MSNAPPHIGEPDDVTKVLNAALSAVGVDYKWGGNSLATGVDCSGLLQQAFMTAGYMLPRVSNDQARAGTSLLSNRIEDLRPGDLLSWDLNDRNEGADHIAIYIGNGQMVHAPREGSKVEVVPVRSGYSATRVIGERPKGGRSEPPHIGMPFNGLGSSGLTWSPTGVVEGGSAGGGDPVGGALGFIDAQTDQFLDGLKQVESSGGNYQAIESSGSTTASGAYQVLDSTWNNFEGYARAAQAPPEVQDRFARELVLDYFQQFNGDWGLVAVAWHAGPDDAARVQRDGWAAIAGVGDVNMGTQDYVKKVLGAAGLGSPAAGVEGAPLGPGDVQAGVPPGVADVGLPPDASPEQVRQWIIDNYPSYSAFIDHPDLGPLLESAAREDWTATKLQAEVQQTEWWQTTGEAAREWETLLITDPASAEAEIDRRVAELEDMSEPFGLNFGGPEGLAEVAEQSLKFGWGEAELRNRIGEQLRHQQDVRGLEGRGAADASELRARARSNWLIPLSEEDAETWAIRMFEGSADEATFEQFLRDQARARFPWMDDQIANGVTPSQHYAPLKNTIAEELEITPSQIDLLEPRWSKIIDYSEPGTGERRAMTFWEAQQFARNQPEYRQTRGAQQNAAELGEDLLRRFGRVS